ncbi:MAG: ribosome recycling factor [Gammaproteobacteria bacterium]|nr:ribosome recycling factor [Gammaproteobacteria bacterium]|tara:strand:- start:3262 stop:3819 length:558 start_codon:yes stop_codon:yes gene_type:complete
MLNEIIEDTKKGMEKSLNSLDIAFKKIRTGRASPALLDEIKVDYYGTLTPLSQLANISVEDAKTLAIIPWEKSIVQDIEKTIMESDLGINPATSGDTIRVILPDLTEETRKEFIKKAKSDAENTKVSIRNVRREGNSQLKEFLKEKEISEDEERQGEEEIQKLTDIYVNKVDEILSFKEKDLLDF